MNNKLIKFMTFINAIFKDINNTNINSSLKLKTGKLLIHEALSGNSKICTMFIYTYITNCLYGVWYNFNLRTN